MVGGGAAALTISLTHKSHPAASSPTTTGTEGAPTTAGSVVTTTTTTTGPSGGTTTTALSHLTQAQYEAQCTASPGYSKLSNKKTANGTCVTYQAEVFQYDVRTGFAVMLAAVTEHSAGHWGNIVDLQLPVSVVSQKFVEGDVIRFWGVTAGTHTYRTVAHTHKTVPVVNVAYASFVQSAQAAYEAACKGAPTYPHLVSTKEPKGRCVTYQAEVFQYDKTHTGPDVMLVAVTKVASGGWNDIVILQLPAPVVSEKFIQGDVIQFWGVTNGLHTYETVSHAHKTVPLVQVAYASLVTPARS